MIYKLDESVYAKAIDRHVRGVPLTIETNSDLLINSLMKMRREVHKLNYYPPDTLLVGFKVVPLLKLNADFIVSEDFNVTPATGKIGSIYGMTVWSDAHLPNSEAFIPFNQLVVIGDRGGVEMSTVGCVNVTGL